MTEPSTRPGRLVVVGTGIRAVGQVTLEAAAWIERADIVCYGLSDAVTERWLRARARATEDLTAWYDPTLPRRASYAAMAGRLVAHVLAGRTTVAALYGHPGVFADPAHRAVAWLREHGHDAVMLPAVSAEDCLFADLGVDPGTIGCMSVEATDLIRRRRRPSTDSHLVVWQIASIDNDGFVPGHRYRGGVEPLVAYLADFYPADHEVVHYMAAQVPGFAPVVHAVALDRLADEVVTGASTLYVPPLGPDHPPEAPSFEPAVVDLAGAMAPTAEGASQPGALVDLLVGLATDPDEMTAYAADPLRAVSAAGLDVVEQFALLGGHTGLVQEAVRLGSGPAAAVSLGLTRTEAQAVASCVGWLEREAGRRAQASGRR